MYNLQVVSTGSYLPSKILTNHDISLLVDTSDDWIVERTGIQKRCIVSSDELTSDLAVGAVIDAIQKSGLGIDEIDGLILATTTPDVIFPATATIVQHKLFQRLGIKINFAFDIQSVCSGFVYAMSLANSLIVSNLAKTILVVGAETMSRIVNWNDRETCVLFGDGAGALLVKSVYHGSSDSRVVYNDLHTDGSLFAILYTALDNNSGNYYVKMEGREVFRHAVLKMSHSIETIIANSLWDKLEIDYVFLHQANLRITQSIAKRLNIDINKFVQTIQYHANTSAASIPLIVNYAFQNSLLQRGHKIVLEAFGAGLSWGGLSMIW